MAQQTEKKIKLQPIGNRVIAERIEQEQTLKGGIILPDSAKKKQETLKVLAVGSGRLSKTGEMVPCPVKTGDVILMDKYAGQEVSIDGEDFVIINSDEIIAIIEE
jgi:chaperonin GroES